MQVMVHDPMVPSSNRPYFKESSPPGTLDMALSRALGGLHFSPQQVEQVIQEVKAELPPQFHFRHGSSQGGSNSGDSVDILAAPLEVWNTEFGRDTTTMNVSGVQAV
jgi:hypothetical protein